MSEALLAQWKDRVLEAETEISVVQEEIDAVHRERKSLKQQIAKYDDVIQNEKQDLLRRLEEVEKEAKDLGESCERTLAEKDRVEAVYIKTLDEYESMHFLVHEIKDEEAALASREDLEQRMQRETLAWAEEEHRLRTQLNNMQMLAKQSRTRQQAEVTELEAELANLETRQRRERADREGEARQQVRSAVRGSRQTTPRPALHNNSTTSTTTTTSSAATHSSKVDSFVAANTSGGVPLKSCLKGGLPLSAGPGLATTKTAASSYSAPVSRATSQSLVLDEESGPVPSLEMLQQMRAYSYAAPGKKASRKREVFGDSTNEQ